MRLETILASCLRSCKHGLGRATAYVAAVSFTHVDAASLAIFRICFGTVMTWHAVRYGMGGDLERHLIAPTLHFRYAGFEWLPAVSGQFLHAINVALAISAAAIAMGLLYRIATIVFTAAHTYLFLLDSALYLNHAYLIALLGLLLAIVPAHTLWSVDRWLFRGSRWPTTAPFWSLLLLRFQVGVVYVFGGIAKLDADWLQGLPIRQWLPGQANAPFVNFVLGHHWEVPFFAYGGLLVDLLAVPGLIWKRTRSGAMLMVVIFHLLNSQLFDIGVFPWLMIAATTLLLDPMWPRRAGAFLRSEPFAAQDYQPRNVLGTGPPSLLLLIGSYQ